jgi:LDH2 family malate/lactate/ureidoglycolate dehydrogenase
MSTKPIISNEKEKKRDQDFITAEVAMKRAAQKAREKAKRVGTGVVVLKDGRIVEEGSEKSV